MSETCLQSLGYHVQHEGDIIAGELEHGLDEHDAQALDIHAVWGEAVQPEQREAAVQRIVLHPALQELQVYTGQFVWREGSCLILQCCILSVCFSDDYLLLKLWLQLWGPAKSI